MIFIKSHIVNFYKNISFVSLKFFGLFFAYLLVLYILVNLNFFNFLQAIISNPRSEFILEAILQPKSEYPVNLLFNVDPFLTTTSDPNVNIIHKKINTLIFSSLFKLDSENKVINDLVENYSFVEPHKIQIKIKNYVFWHDYNLLTVDDIIFTFDLIKSFGDKTFYVGAINGGDFKINKVDDFIFEIILVDSENNPRPNSSYLVFLDFPILPKHILYSYSTNSILNLPFTDFGKKPIGSGPFVYFRNKVAELELYKFKNYYSGDIFDIFSSNKNINKYIFKLMPSLDRILYEFKLGFVDIFIQNYVPFDNDVFKSSSVDFRYFNIMGQKFVLFFNLNKKESFFNGSALLRRALVKGLDRNILAQNTGLDFSVLGPIDVGSEYFFNSTHINFDLEEYRSRLDSLGFKFKDSYFYKNDKKLTLTLTYLDEGYSKLIASNLTTHLESIGIQVIMRPIQKYPVFDQNGVLLQSSFVDTVYNRDYEVLLIPVINFPMPNIYDEWHSSRANPPGLNFSNFASRAADLYLEQSRVSFNEDQKSALINFQKIFYEEMPAIYLAYPRVKVLYSKRINILVPETKNNLYDTYELYRFIKY